MIPNFNDLSYENDYVLFSCIHFIMGIGFTLLLDGNWTYQKLKQTSHLFACILTFTCFFWISIHTFLESKVSPRWQAVV